MLFFLASTDGKEKLRKYSYITTIKCLIKWFDNKENMHDCGCDLVVVTF